MCKICYNLPVRSICRPTTPLILAKHHLNAAKLACERAAKMCAAERKVPSFAEVHILATDGSTFLQLKMAGAGIPGAKCKI